MDEDNGTKRLMTNVFKFLEKELDCDIEELESNIKDVVIKVISLINLFLNTYK